MAKIDERMTSVEGELNWHRRIGWGAVGVSGSLFLLLLTWYIPKELSGLRESVRAEATAQAQNIKADTSTQLEPVKVELARLSALMDLARTKNPAKVFQQSLSRAADAPSAAAQTIAAVAQQAREDGLRTSTSKLLEVNDQLQALVKADPDVRRVVWYARLELVGYRTFLNVGQTLGPKAPTPVYKFPGVVMDGSHLIGKVQGARQSLDGFYWRNAVFEKMIITYNGGPMALENVLFIDCTFEMAPTPMSEKLANTLIAQNRVTQIFQ